MNRSGQSDHKTFLKYLFDPTDTGLSNPRKKDQYFREICFYHNKQTNLLRGKELTE